MSPSTTRGLEEQVGRTGARKGEAEVADAGRCAGCQATDARRGRRQERGRTGALLYKYGPSFNHVNADVVIARRRD